MSLARNAASLMVAGLIVTGLSACTSGSDGNAIARDQAGVEAERMAAHLDNSFEVHDADYLAANAEPDTHRSQWSTIAVEPLAWSGVTNVEPGAVIELRYTVTVAEHSVGGFNPTVSAGSAVRCFRFTVLFNKSSMEEFGCPDGPAPAPPTPAPLLLLPEDAYDRVVAVLTVTTADTLDHDVAAAFPEDHLLIETESFEGMLIVAMRAAINNDCLLVVRAADGTIRSGADPTYSQPGELGCSTRLVTNPPL